MKYIAICTGEYPDFMAHGYYIVPDDFEIDMEDERLLFIEENKEELDDLLYEFVSVKPKGDRTEALRIWKELEFANWLIRKYNLDEYEVEMHEWHVMD